jgi:DNA polymerase delta subunit 2
MQYLTLHRKDDFSTLNRVASSYSPLHNFLLPKGEKKHYTQQFADLYFLRLAILKPDIEKIAEEAWVNFEVISNPTR